MKYKLKYEYITVGMGNITHLSHADDANRAIIRRKRN
jgi:hypothetical protein